MGARGELGTQSSEERRRQSRWIRAGLAYVPHVARRYSGFGLPFEELLAAGNLGLVQAALRFEPTRNVKFVTYADWWIRKAIFKVLEEQSGPVRLPRYRQEQLRRLRESRRAWQRHSGHEPDSEQLASATGLTRAEVDRLRTLNQGAVSLEEPPVRGGDRPLGELLADEGGGPQESLVREDLVQRIRTLIDDLPPKERRVVLLRFGFGHHEPMTLRQIGSRLGISRERVRQLERRALTHLRGTL